MNVYISQYNYFNIYIIWNCSLEIIAFCTSHKINDVLTILNGYHQSMNGEF